MDSWDNLMREMLECVLNSDYEAAHSKADSILVRALRMAAYGGDNSIAVESILMNYEAVRKHYA